MRKLNALRWLLAAGALILSSIATAQKVRISEIHYDNTGTDAGEAIEISAPAGTDLTGWQIVLYNGNGGASYNTRRLSGDDPGDLRDTRRHGPQLSVERHPERRARRHRAGRRQRRRRRVPLVRRRLHRHERPGERPDLGRHRRQPRTAPNPSGQSLARNAAGVWSGPTTSTFGACNDDGSSRRRRWSRASRSRPRPPRSTRRELSVHRDGVRRGEQPIAGVTFTWTSSNPAVATVSAGGVATGVGRGDATITATAPNGVAGSAALHVNRRRHRRRFPSPLQRDPLRQRRHRRRRGDRDRRTRGRRRSPAWSSCCTTATAALSYNTTVLSGRSGELRHARRGRRQLSVQTASRTAVPTAWRSSIPSGQVVEFLSYEGTFTADERTGRGHDRRPTSAPTEASSSPIGASLQRDAGGVWALATSTLRRVQRRRRTATARATRSRSPGAYPATRRCPSASRTSSSRPCATQQRRRSRRRSRGRRRRRRSPASTQNGVFPALAAGIGSTSAPRRPTARRLRTRCPRASPSRAASRIRATPSSASPPTPTRATTSSCATRSTRLRTTRIAARPTG